MKKSVVIFLVIISIFVASCAPQVAAVPEVTVTSLPPTATQTPEPSATPTAVYTPTPAQETISIGGGLSIVLGEPVDGGTVIDSFVADSAFTPEQQADKVNEVDYTDWGFEAGSLIWMQNSEGKTELVRADDHNRVVGWWMRSKANAKTEMVWNAPELIDPHTGESIFFKPGIARTWSADTVYTTELDTMRASINAIFQNQGKDWVVDRNVAAAFPTIRVTSGDQKDVFFGLFVRPTNDVKVKTGDGVLFFEGDEVDANGNYVIRELTLTNFDYIQG